MGYSIRIVLFLLTIVLAIICLRNIANYISNKRRGKVEMYSILFMLFTLTTISLKLFGFLNFEEMRGKTLLIANREGAANCMTTLKLRTGNRFTLRSVCFEIDKTWGSYLISNDTVYFKKPRGYHDEDFYEFGIIKTSSFDWNKGGQEFFLFRNKKDTSEMYLTVIENNL